MRLALTLTAILAATAASAQRRPRRPTPPPPPSAPALSPMQRAALCRALRDEPARNQCIVEALRDAQTEQELGVLSATYMTMGRTQDAIRVMREHLRRTGTPRPPPWMDFPSSPPAPGDYPVGPPPRPPEPPGEAGRRGPPPRASI